MSEDTLQQEEIDALLKAAGAEEEEPGKKEPAKEFADDFLGSSNEILLSLLGNDALVKKGESGAIPVDMFAQELSGSSALAFVDATKGITSKVVLIFDEKKMTSVTDLILMGEGAEKEAFTDDDKDALKEAVNQIMGNLGQNLTGKYGTTISFEQAQIQISNPEEALALVKEKIPDDSFYRALYTLKVDENVDTQFRLLVPLSMEKELSALSSQAAEKKEETRAAQAPSAKSGQPAASGTDPLKNLDIILDLQVEIIVKLGEAVMPLRDVTKIVTGNILPLDKFADAPIDVMVNNKVVAKGELVVLPPYDFAIKVTEVKDKMKRIKNVMLH